jgi:hypothetical protein
MGEKTGIRRICKTLPQEAVAAEALGIDETISELNQVPVRGAPAELEDIVDADYKEMTKALQEKADSADQQIEEPVSKSEKAQESAANETAGKKGKEAQPPEKSAAAAKPPQKAPEAAQEPKQEQAADDKKQGNSQEGGGQEPELELGPRRQTEPASEEEKPGVFQVEAMNLCKKLGWTSDQLKIELASEFKFNALIEVPVKKRPLVLAHLRELIRGRQ